MVSGGLILAGIATTARSLPHGLSLEFIWIIWSALLVRFVWKGLQWYVENIGISSHQVLMYSGFVRRKVVARSLVSVTNITLHRSIAGRFFGYGELRFESVSQTEPFWTINHVPYPSQVFLELYGGTFPGSLESGEADRHLRGV
jgi:ammonia channel protein AmtB